MSFISIPTSIITVGSAIKKELWDYVKNNFDDHETRLNGIETNAAKIPIMKFYVLNASSFSTATGLYYWESNDNLTITNAYVQIFEKGTLTGFFEIDIKRSTTNLDGTSFTSIFTTKPKIDFSTASNYSKSTNQVFNVPQITVASGNYLRLDITQMPNTSVMSKFLITVYGE